MRIVIVGGSKFGTATAERLIEQGHEVVIIDRDRSRLERLSETLDCGMVEGDGTSPSVLREARAGEDDVLIALTNASDDNILAALVGRSVGFGRVIPQIISPELREVCAELDLTDTITPHATVARSLCRALEDHAEVSETLNLSNELRLKRIVMPDGWETRKVSELDLPDTCRPIAHIRDAAETLVSSETNLAEGDELLLATHTDAIKALDDLFGSGNL